MRSIRSWISHPAAFVSRNIPLQKYFLSSHNFYRFSFSRWKFSIFSKQKKNFCPKSLVVAAAVVVVFAMVMKQLKAPSPEKEKNNNTEMCSQLASMIFPHLYLPLAFSLSHSDTYTFTLLLRHAQTHTHTLSLCLTRSLALSLSSLPIEDRLSQTSILPESATTRGAETFLTVNERVNHRLIKRIFSAFKRAWV